MYNKQNGDLVLTCTLYPQVALFCIKTIKFDIERRYGIKEVESPENGLLQPPTKPVLCTAPSGCAPRLEENIAHVVRSTHPNFRSVEPRPVPSKPNLTVSSGREVSTSHKAIGSSAVLAARGHPGLDRRKDQSIALKNNSGSELEFRAVPRIVFLIARYRTFKTGRAQRKDHLVQLDTIVKTPVAFSSVYAPNFADIQMLFDESESAPVASNIVDFGLLLVQQALAMAAHCIENGACTEADLAALADKVAGSSELTGTEKSYLAGVLRRVGTGRISRNVAAAILRAASIGVQLWSLNACVSEAAH